MTEGWEWDESVTSNGVVGATIPDQEGRRNPRRRALHITENASIHGIMLRCPEPKPDFIYIIYTFLINSVLGVQLFAQSF